MGHSMRSLFQAVVFLALLAPIAGEAQQLHLTQENLNIPTKDGMSLPAVIVRNQRATAARLPVALFTSTPGTGDAKYSRAEYAASRGYIGVSCDLRGHEHDAKDLFDVIDWISKQPWSDGQVGMWGGSAAGAAQWAAAKSRHSALKTIVPAAPQDVGYSSAGYDDYWQRFTAHGKDYERVNIPVLAIDGYYDAAQANAVLRLMEHYKRNSKAEHYLVIGPYDAVDAQAVPVVLRGYAIDPIAQLDTRDLTFQWFDHVMKGGPKPAILKDRINYQVMGANVWKHSPSVAKMSSETLTFYLSDTRDGDYYRLSTHKPDANGALRQTVRFGGAAVGPGPTPILSSALNRTTGYLFVSEPFQTPLAVNGMFTARLRAILNKKDLDVAMVLYELTPAGEFFYLADTVTRASYAQDMTRRKLLSPQMIETISIERTVLVSRQLSAGSRLILLLDVNRGPDVSAETIGDATTPLQVEWLTESYVKVPLSR